MKRLVVIAIILIITSSCRFMDSLFHGDVVARINNKSLYRSEIEGLIPKNTSPEDSLRMAQQYIQSWATKNLLLSLADSQLSKEEKKEVQRELEEYNASLMVFRYEKDYLDNRLDTLVTEGEKMDYYKQYSHTFVYNEPVVKGRLIKINLNSPNYPIIKNLYTVTSIEGLVELEELCYSSADEYTDFDNQWIPLSLLAREAQTDLSSLSGELKKNGFVEHKSDRFSFLIAVYDMIPEGEITPFEFNSAKIRHAIISKRRQTLIEDLEKDIYRDAVSKNKLKIYNKR